MSENSTPEDKPGPTEETPNAAPRKGRVTRGFPKWLDNCDGAIIFNAWLPQVKGDKQSSAPKVDVPSPFDADN